MRWQVRATGSRTALALLLLPFGLASEFYDRDLVHATLSGSYVNATIEAFTYGGCFLADVALGALGVNYSSSSIAPLWPGACADSCADFEAYLVGASGCICVQPSSFNLDAWQQLEETNCDVLCDGWSSQDFGTLSPYFASLPGFCGGSSANVFSFYETWNGVMAVGQGLLDRTRTLWWQVVLVQSLMYSSLHRDLYEEGTWVWRLHASSANTGRAAFPLHRDLPEPIVGLMLDNEAEMPMVLGTSSQGSLYATPAGIRSETTIIVDGASFLGHTVDGTPVVPGAAPIATFDQDRRTIFATQPVGNGSSSLYALELDAPNDFAYRHFRFIPFCNASWCAVNELRFRFQEVEVDLSMAATYFYNDLSDTTLRNGAMLFDFPTAIFVDEFSISIPYNTTASVPDRWVLQGTNDRVRRCVLSGAPSYQSMRDGTYAQMMGETNDGRSVYRDSTGSMIYYDATSVSWWVSPRIQQGGYGAIRCVGDVSDPHLLVQPCVAWNGQIWDAAAVSFACLGNEWTVLHQQSSSYPLPLVKSAPVRWFKVSRLAVNWDLLLDDIPGLAGQIFSDPSDGYVTAGLTLEDEHRVRTLGRASGSSGSTARCSVTLRVNVSFEDAMDPGHPLDCKATAFGVGGWLWPDAEGTGQLWLTCATNTEFDTDNWAQKYAETTADGSFSFTSALEKSPDQHKLKSHIARALELAVAPTVVSSISLSGPTNYFVCPIQSNCTFDPNLEIRIISGGKSCGCAEEVLTIETHGFYKACYCLADSFTASGGCTTDGDFTNFAGTILGAGPEPARLVQVQLELGQSYDAAISGYTSHEDIYKTMLEYAAGPINVLDFPSSVQISQGSAPGCGYNPSACDLVGEVFCTLGEQCVVSLNGTSLRTFNGLKVIRKSYPCISALAYPALAAFEGLSNPKDGCFRSDGHKAAYRPVHHWDLGNSTRGAQTVTTEEPGPGVYKLCWSYDPRITNASTFTATDYMELYRADAGYLMMLGPLAMDFECFLHFPCIINISGVGLAASNMVLLIEATSRCGDENVEALDARWSSAAVPAAVVQDAMGNFNLYHFGSNVGKSGVSLRICWAHDPKAEAEERSTVIEDSSLYRVEIDPDFFWFRLTAIVDCVTYGRPCTVTLMGSGILPSSKILLITNAGRCGQANATALLLPGFINPAPVEVNESTGTGPSVQGLYILSERTLEAPPSAFRICWGSNPGSNNSMVDFPFEVEYPTYYSPSAFFEHRVGAVTLAQLDSENDARHRVLAIYGDPTETPFTSNTLTGSTSEWLDYDCCGMAGHAAGSVLRVDASNVARPAEGYVFHQRPSDSYVAVALTTRGPLRQGILDCADCDDFTTKHTDYVVLTGFRDLSSPLRHPGNVMMLKAQPVGPQSAPTWQARRVSQYFQAMPPQGLVDWQDDYRPCVTPDPHAVCAYTSREAVQSQKVVRLSASWLLSAFLDGPSAGTVLTISVSHHFVDSWSLKMGPKEVVNAGRTSAIDVARLSDDSALVTFVEDDVLQARALQVLPNGTIQLGDVLQLATNMSLTMDNRTEAPANWTFRETHRRLSSSAVQSNKVIIAAAPVLSTAQAFLVTVETLTTSLVAAVTLRDAAGDMTVVTLGPAAVMCIYRDELSGLAKAQEVEVYETYNGQAHFLVLGSMSTFSAFAVEGLMAIRLNATGILTAYKAMDGTGRGMTTLLGAPFNKDT